MAMSYHMEARIKQDRLNRWNEQKIRADAGPSNQGLQDRLDEMAFKEKKDTVLTTDPGQFQQVRSVHTWTGTERNRRFYDQSREGPLNGNSWRELRRELNIREKSLPSAMFENRVMQPDPCFMSK